MIDAVSSFLGMAAALTAWEFVKQVGVRFVKTAAPPAVVLGLQALDQILPGLIAEGVTGSELESRLRQKLGSLTGSDWEQIRLRFDPVAFMNHQQEKRNDYAAGADAQLEADCSWLRRLPQQGDWFANELRAAMRPKPPSLKEQALALLDRRNDPDKDCLDDKAIELIRRALEGLPDE